MENKKIAVLLGIVGTLYLAPIYAEDAPPVQGEQQAEKTPDDNVESVRQELEHLKSVSMQVLQRIQYLESRLQPPAPVQGAAQQGSSQGQVASASQAGSKTVKEPVASRGVDDLTSEVHTLFDQTFSLELGFELGHYDQRQLALNGFLALDAIFLGNISIDEIDSDIYTTSLTARWGVTDRLQLNATVPWIYRETTFRSGGQELAATVSTESTVDDSGIGDISFGLSYQLLPETLDYPDIVWNLSATAPTGQEPYGINYIEHALNTNLQVPDELPTGTGLWALTSGLSFLRTADPAILFANFSYTHYIEDSFSDFSSNPDSEKIGGDIQLGDQVQVGLGMAFAINERTTYAMSFSQTWVDDTTIKLDGGSSQDVIGSDTSTGTFNIGLTYGLTERLSVVSDLGIGLSNDTSDYQFTIKFPYRFD